MVQKSVTQLQSKLISNKDVFMRACQAISEASEEMKISFEEFQSLTPDEIMTLFISFNWLNRNLFSEFTNKRRLLLEEARRHNGDKK